MGRRLCRNLHQRKRTHLRSRVNLFHLRRKLYRWRLCLIQCRRRLCRQRLWRRRLRNRHYLVSYVEKTCRINEYFSLSNCDRLFQFSLFGLCFRCVWRMLVGEQDLSFFAVLFFKKRRTWSRRTTPSSRRSTRSSVWCSSSAGMSTLWADSAAGCSSCPSMASTDDEQGRKNSQFFADQVLAFIKDHGVTPVSIPMPRV